MQPLKEITYSTLIGLMTHTNSKQWQIRAFLGVLISCHVLFPDWPLQEEEIFKGGIIHVTCTDQ